LNAKRGVYAYFDTARIVDNSVEFIARPHALGEARGVRYLRSSKTLEAVGISRERAKALISFREMNQVFHQRYKCRELRR
jgi:hypothetical protein